MSTTLTKKDYKIIGTSTKDPEKIIVEINKNTLESVTTKKRPKKDSSLLEYIQSWEADNQANISEAYTNVEDLIKSMK